MAKESQKGQRYESGSGELYKEFEASLLKSSSNDAKSPLKECWLRFCDLLGLSREDTSLSNKNGGQGTGTEESSLSNKIDPRVMSQLEKLSSNIGKVYGFDNEELSMEKNLLKHPADDHQLKKIGVVGMAGVGKTTLCRKIFKKPDIMSQFVPRIQVCMPRPKSDDNNLEVETVKRILERLGVEEEIINDHGFDGLIYILHQQLIGKRYLIVLDEFLDIEGWCKDLKTGLSQCEEWGKRILKLMPKGYGGTVIVTSRNEESIKKMIAEENLLKLQPLSDPVSCWSIYRDSVRTVIKEFESQTSKELREKLDIEKSRDHPLNEKLIEEIEARLKDQEKAEEELKGKCGGLPLAAKLMGLIKAQLILDAENAPN